MVQNRYIRHILLVILAISVIAITPQVSEAHNDMEKPSVTSDINLSVKLIADEEPIRLIIPRRGININIEYSAVEDGTWRVPEHSAGHAEGSSYLDEPHGNSIVFAHARKGLFRDLLGIQDNEEITIIGSKNIYKYRVTSIEKILPDEIDKIKSLGDHNLTLFTCEGWNDEYRLLVKAKRIDTYSLSSKDEII